MPPSPVKDALAKLDWQEENARAVETVLGTWGVDPTIINVSVFKPITNSAVNQLLTAVTPGSNDPAARKIHNLLMLRRNYTNNINAFLVCNVARDMPLDASSQITLYIDGLFSLISKRVLKFQTLGQDILSLQCLESGALPGYNLTVAILIRKALDNFDMSMTSVLANLCKIPGQALVIWENLRNQTEVRIELWHFFVKEVVPPSLDTPEFPQILNNMISHVTSQPHLFHLNEPLLKLEYFQKIALSDPLTVGSIFAKAIENSHIQQATQVLQRLATILVELMDFKDLRIIKSLVTAVESIVDRDTGGCDHLNFLLFLRIACSLFQQRICVGDFVLASSLLTKIHSKINEPYHNYGSAVIGVINTCGEMTTEFPIIEGSAPPKYVDRADKDQLTVKTTDYQMIEVLKSVTTMFTKTKSIFKDLVPLQFGGPFMVPITLGFATVIQLYLQGNSVPIDNVLGIMLSWVSESPLRPLAVAVSAPKSTSCVAFALAPLIPLISQCVDQPLAMRLLAALGCNKHLGVGIKTSISAIGGLSNRIKAILLTRVYLQEGMSFDSFCQEVLGYCTSSDDKIPTKNLDLLAECIHIAPARVATFYDRMVPWLIENTTDAQSRIDIAAIGEILVSGGQMQIQQAYESIYPIIQSTVMLDMPYDCRLSIAGILRECLRESCIPQIELLLRSTPVPIDNMAQQNVFEQIEPYIVAEWEQGNISLVMKILTPIITVLNAHHLANNDALAIATPIFLKNSNIAVLETPAGLIRTLETYPELLSSNIEDLVEIFAQHRVQIGQRCRGTQSSHPVVIQLAKIFNRSSQCMSYLLPLAETTLATTRNRDFSFEETKTMVLKMIKKAYSPVPLTLSGVREGHINTPCSWEVSLLCWTTSIQYTWRPFFTSIFSGCSMLSRNEVMWSCLQFLLSLLWSGPQSKSGPEQNRTFALCPEADLGGVVQVFLALTGLGLAEPKLATRVVAKLSAILKDTIYQRTDFMQNLAGMVRSYIAASCLICLSLIHHQTVSVPDFLERCVTPAAKAINYSLPQIPILDHAPNLPSHSSEHPEILKNAETDDASMKPTTDSDGNEAEEKSSSSKCLDGHCLVFVSIYYAVVCEVLNATLLGGQIDWNLRNWLWTVSESQQLPILGVLLAYCDLTVLETYPDSSTVKNEILKTFSAPHESLLSVWYPALIPKLVQLMWIPDKQVIDSIQELKSPHRDGTWNAWGECIFLGGLMAQGIPWVKDAFKDRLLASLYQRKMTSTFSENQSYCQLASMFSLLGIPFLLPTSLVSPGDTRNHIRYPIQYFLSLVSSLEYGVNPVGGELLLWLSSRPASSTPGRKAGGSKPGVYDNLSLGSLNHMTLLFAVVLFRNLRSYTGSGLGVDMLPKSNLVTWALTMLDREKTFHNSLCIILSKVETLPDINLKSTLAAIGDRLMKTDDDDLVGDKLISLWELCIAHSPKEGFLASLLLDFHTKFPWNNRPLRMRLQFIRTVVIPLALLLTPRQWFVLVLECVRSPEKSIVHTVILRQLTCLAILAKHHLTVAEEFSNALQENSVRHIVPEAWETKLRSLSVTVTQENEAAGVSTMARYSKTAHECLKAVMPRLLSEYIISLQGDSTEPHVLNSAAMFMAQVHELPVIWDDICIPLLTKLNAQILGYLFVKGSVTEELWLKKMDLMIGNPITSMQENIAFALATSRRGPLLTTRLLNKCLRFGIRGAESVSNSLELGYCLALSCSDPVTLMFGVFGGDARQSDRRVLKIKPVAGLKPVHWDYLFHSRDGIDLLIENGLEESFGMPFLMSSKVVCEIPPLARFWSLLDSLADTNNEPQNRVLVTYADQENAEKSERQFSSQILLKSLEARKDWNYFPKCQFIPMPLNCLNVKIQYSTAEAGIRRLAKRFKDNSLVECAERFRQHVLES